MKFIDLDAQRERIADKIYDQVHKVIDSGQFIMGPQIKEFEQKLADYVGVKHCIGVSNGTEALLLAMLALDIGPGDEVITTPFTFFATGEMISLIGATPVFVDIEPDTYNINPDLIEAAITEKTKAIAPVSLYGQCADMTRINAIAEKHNLPVIEDAAQSMGATHHGKKSCGLSTIACTSFFPSKPLGCYGDGGACFTNDDELAEILRQLRVHGQSKRYTHTRIGINGRLDTLQAAILLEKLEIFPDEVEKRQEIAKQYSEALGDAVRKPMIRDENTSVFAQYTIEVDNRDDVQAKLKEQGIPTAVHYPVPLYRQPAYDMAHLADQFPVSEAASKRVMSLPFHPYLDAASVEKVVNALLEC